MAHGVLYAETIPVNIPLACTKQNTHPSASDSFATLALFKFTYLPTYLLVTTAFTIEIMELRLYLSQLV